MSKAPPVVPAEVVEATLELFDALDQAKDEAAMHDLARRLGREQPAILERAAAITPEHGEAAGQAAVFYTTLVWTMFDRHAGLELPRVTTDNVQKAEAEIVGALGRIADLEAREVSARIAPALEERQPHLVSRLREMISEDVRGEALTEDVAAVVAPTVQIVIEAFDAALSGRRLGLPRAPVRPKGPKVGRNEPCPCGSGKKHKRCCG
jgi:hypothetical protein